MEQTEVNSKNWKSLIKPAKLDVQLSDDKTFAKITAEPLEKGYGLTPVSYTHLTLPTIYSV